MQESSRKWLLFGLVAVCIVAIARVANPLYDYYKAQASSREMAARHSRPDEIVRRLLDRADPAPPRLDGSFPCVFASVENSRPRSQLGKCGLPTEHSAPVSRLEADLRYGNFVVRESDLYVNDVFAVPLTRSYNSNDYLNPNPVHAFGKHANHPFDIAPLGSRYPYTYLMLVLEDGDFLYFPRVSEGTDFSTAVYQHTETSTSFYKAVVAWNGDGWTLFRADGPMVLFPEAYNSTSAAQGAPTAMRDAKGNTLQLIRDEQRNLQEIRTPHEHSIRFQYDGESRITRAEDDQGQWAEYRYDPSSMLTDVTMSSGRVRHYSYDGDLMTEVKDEKGQVLVRNTYDKRWLVRQDFGNGEVYSYDYHISDLSNSYADSVTVTLPDGTATTVEVADAVPEARKHPPQ